MRMEGLDTMKRTHPSARIWLTLLALILLLLPVYGYACILPMLGTTSHAQSTHCPFTDCGLGKPQETTYKHCESLKRAQVQSSLSLQDVLAKTPIAPLSSPLSILPEVSQAHCILNTSEETRLPASAEIYILHHTLLL